MNLDEFKSKAQKDASRVKLLKKAYQVKLALAETLREKAESAVLKVNEFRSSFDNSVITEPKQTYEIADEQKELFYQLRNIALDELKILHPRASEGYCSACVADYNVVKHENKIFNLVLEWLPVDMAETFKSNSFKSKSKIISLFMSLEFKTA